MSVAEQTIITQSPYRCIRSGLNCGDVRVLSRGICRGEEVWVESGSLRFDHGPNIIAAANAAYRMRDAVRHLSAAIAEGGDVDAAMQAVEEAACGVPHR